MQFLKCSEFQKITKFSKKTHSFYNCKSENDDNTSSPLNNVVIFQLNSTFKTLKKFPFRKHQTVKPFSVIIDKQTKIDLVEQKTTVVNSSINQRVNKLRKLASLAQQYICLEMPFPPFLPLFSA